MPEPELSREAKEAIRIMIPQRPWIVTILCFILLIQTIIIIYNYKLTRDDVKTSLADKEFADVNLIKDAYSIKGDNRDFSQPPYIRLLAIFNENLKRYKDNLLGLYSNLFYHFLFILLTFIIVLKPTPEIEFPIINFKMDLKTPWIYVAVSLCLIYLWVKLGYLFNLLINDRMILWLLSESLEPGIEAQIILIEPRQADIYRSENWKLLVHTASLRHLLHDGGFMDGWFLEFRKYFQELLLPPYGQKVVQVLLFSLVYSLGFLMVVFWVFFCTVLRCLYIALF